MDWDEFEQWSKHLAGWGARYHKTIGRLPVRPNVEPGDLEKILPSGPPERPEPFATILSDFEKLVMPGMTHWQHPRFFAYFPANAAPPSILAEQIVSTIAPQCMLWQTSPAASELETVMLDWLRQAVGLPSDFTGVIQDSASSATLAAVLVMRERALDFAGRKQGLAGQPVLRVYASSEAHSSIDRAVWIAGIGAENLVRIPISGPRRAMDPKALNRQIETDRDHGFLPIGIIACTGGTGAGACDELGVLGAIAKKNSLFLHVDAAWAGAAMILPEARSLWRGVETADSIVFNPHKWLGAQFDCSAHYMRDPGALRRVLTAEPEYLRTHSHQDVIDYSQMSIPLGRRFRALKLWFLIRTYGLGGLRKILREHIRLSHKLAERLGNEPDFQIITQPVLSLFTFRHKPASNIGLDAHNQAVVDAINDDGRIYLTQTSLDGRKVIRFQAGSFGTRESDLEIAFETITSLARAAG